MTEIGFPSPALCWSAAEPGERRDRRCAVALRSAKMLAKTGRVRNAGRPGQALRAGVFGRQKLAKPARGKYAGQALRGGSSIGENASKNEKGARAIRGQALRAGVFDREKKLAKNGKGARRGVSEDRRCLGCFVWAALTGPLCLGRFVWAAAISNAETQIKYL